MYDAAIIGCGIVGAAAAYTLAEYDVRTIVIEKENDVSLGTSRANTALIHAGYDPVPGSQMARFNLEGAGLYPKLCEKLGVPYQQTGSLVLAFSTSQLELIASLYQRGLENGVPGLALWSRAEVLAAEPNVNTDVKGALYAPTCGLIDPWQMTIALAEYAQANGVAFLMEAPVTAIAREEGCFVIETPKGNVRAKRVLNTAGLHAGEIAAMAGDPLPITVTPQKGEYFLLDKEAAATVNHVLFQCPNHLGKGVVVSPTVHGNLIIGPNSMPAEFDDTATTREGLSEVRIKSTNSVAHLDFSLNIRNFAGLRAVANSGDFYVHRGTQGLYHAAGICSPGLTSAPAIANHLIALMEEDGFPLKKRAPSISYTLPKRFADATIEEKRQLISNNALYGRVICRCETVTEAEVIDALRSPLCPPTIDAVKRRCNAGMGRCQGGFCGGKIAKIIARERGIPLSQVLQNKSGSQIYFTEELPCM